MTTKETVGCKDLESLSFNKLHSSLPTSDLDDLTLPRMVAPTLTSDLPEMGAICTRHFQMAINNASHDHSGGVNPSVFPQKHHYRKIANSLSGNIL